MPEELPVGTEILVENTRDKQRKGGKLEKAFKGPYIINKSLGKGIYEIRSGVDGKVLKQKVNIGRIKVYRRRKEENEGKQKEGENHNEDEQKEGENHNEDEQKEGENHNEDEQKEGENHNEDEQKEGENHNAEIRKRRKEETHNDKNGMRKKRGILYTLYFLIIIYT